MSIRRITFLFCDGPECGPYERMNAFRPEPCSSETAASQRLPCSWKGRQQPRLVRLSRVDEAYVEKLRAEDRINDLAAHRELLIETRSQRLGISRSELCHCANYELERHLADELFILAGARPWHDPAAWIDDQRVECIAKNNLAHDWRMFHAYKAWKEAGGTLPDGTKKTPRRTSRRRQA